MSVEKIPYDEYIGTVASETACTKLPYQDSQSLRAEVADILKTARTPKSNISKEERKALGELKKSKDLLIMGSDKGKCTVVQCKVDYEKKVNDRA